MNLSDEALNVKNVMGELTMGEVWTRLKDSMSAVKVEVRSQEDWGTLGGNEFFTDDFNWDESLGCVFIDIYNPSTEDNDLTFAVMYDSRVRIVDNKVHAKDMDGVEITLTFLSKLPIPFSIAQQ